MGVHTKDLGRTTICMDRERTLGVMAVNMRESTIWIKNMATEFTSGLMVVVMRAIGKMGNNMARANT